MARLKTAYRPNIPAENPSRKLKSTANGPKPRSAWALIFRAKMVPSMSLSRKPRRPMMQRLRSSGRSMPCGFPRTCSASTRRRLPTGDRRPAISFCTCGGPKAWPSPRKLSCAENPEMIDHAAITALAANQAAQRGHERGTDAHRHATREIFHQHLAHLQAQAPANSAPQPTAAFFQPPPPPAPRTRLPCIPRR